MKIKEIKNLLKELNYEVEVNDFVKKDSIDLNFSPKIHEHSWAGGYGEICFLVKATGGSIDELESGRSFSNNGRLTSDCDAAPIGVQLSKLSAADDIIVIHSWYEYNHEWRKPEWLYYILTSTDMKSCQSMVEEEENREA